VKEYSLGWLGTWAEGKPAAHEIFADVFPVPGSASQYQGTRWGLGASFLHYTSHGTCGASVLLVAGLVTYSATFAGNCAGPAIEVDFGHRLARIGTPLGSFGMPRLWSWGG